MCHDGQGYPQKYQLPAMWGKRQRVLVESKEKCIGMSSLGSPGCLIIPLSATIKIAFVEYIYPSKLICSTFAIAGYTISLQNIGIFLA